MEDTGSRTLFASYVTFVSVTVCLWLVHKLYPGYFSTFKTFPLIAVFLIWVLSIERAYTISHA